MAVGRTFVRRPTWPAAAAREHAHRLRVLGLGLRIRLDLPRESSIAFSLNSLSLIATTWCGRSAIDTASA